jgi:DNA-binding transcriptional MerR regulator
LNKAPDAFRTISEVAEDLDLPQHVLRFWESRFPQIKPMKRGGGRRYYRPDDVDLLRGIRHLLYGEGYTIRGVQRILREQGSRFVQLVWQEGAPQPPERLPEDAEPEAHEAHEERAPARARSLLELLPPLFAADTGDGAARLEPRLEAAPAEHEGEKPGPVSAPPPLAAEQSGGNTPPAPAAPAGLSAADLERLQGALRDLADCRRLLDEALAAT